MKESKQTAGRNTSFDSIPGSAGTLSVKFSDSVSVEFSDSVGVTTIATFCIVCKESVDLTKEEECMMMYGRPIPPKVCDNCRKAILEMRRQIGC